MIRTKIAAVAFGAALGMGAIAATALPATADSSSTEVQTTVPGVGTTTITLPGIGDITVTIDATTGAISGVSIVTVDGVTAAAPVVLPNGDLQIPVTLADGTQQTVQVSGELEHGVPTVETEVKAPESDDESEGGDTESQHEGEHSTPPTTGSPTSGVPSHGEDD
jgi:hypothetical protein